MNIKPFLVARERAMRLGDFNVVQEIDMELRRLGIPVLSEQAVTEEPQERAVPVKRGPGRPRKVVEAE